MFYCRSLKYRVQSTERVLIFIKYLCVLFRCLISVFMCSSQYQSMMPYTLRFPHNKDGKETIPHYIQPNTYQMVSQKNKSFLYNSSIAHIIQIFVLFLFSLFISYKPRNFFMFCSVIFHSVFPFRFIWKSIWN